MPSFIHHFNFVGLAPKKPFILDHMLNEEIQNYEHHV
jgi:hypothetical protein